jgi:hypothetical protein
MDNQTFVVVVSASATGRLKVACPWCGMINRIAVMGVQPLPSCGHVADVRQTPGDTPATGGDLPTM